MAEDPIRVEGLREFVAALRGVSSDLPKAVRLAANSAANIVVKAARPEVPTGPGKGGHAASSVKASSTRTAARVQGGGKKYPYYPWLDFGGRVGRNKSVHRPFLKRGRYIWAAYGDHADDVHQELWDGLQDVAESAGLNLEQGGG